MMEVFTMEARFFMIREREIKQASNGSLYANFVLQQQHTLLSARLWDITNDQQQKFSPKSVVKVEGTLETFRSKQMLTIKKIRLATEDDHINRTELISKPGLSREDLWHELRMMMDEIQSPTLQQVVKEVYSNRAIREKVTTYPAAKTYHHAYYAGLLEQIVELMSLALQVLPLYKTINRDTVLAACLLGDIGKIQALHDPLTPEYTQAGELIGQVILSIEMINQAVHQQGIDQTDPQLMQVKHTILGQYDQTEETSVKPKTAEAILYFYLKRMNTELRALEQVEEGSFPYVPLFKRNMYVNANEEGESEE